MRKRTHEEFIKQMKVINNNIEFYLPLHNITIEYDGEHHSQIVRYSNESIDLAKERFIQRQINDTIKTQYCNKHNIKLIRIPYTEYNEVENILDKFLF